MRPRVLLSWSTGKDSAWTLHMLRRAGEVELAGLLTSMNGEFDRVAMHAVRRSLLQAQAAATGLPLYTVPLPWPCSNDAYEAAMRQFLEQARDELGVTHLAFGDLFLQDVRAYRERLLAGTGIEPLFPLWEEPTPQLARRMVDSGLRAILTCVDPARLPAAFAGRTFDSSLLQDLPPGVDPCGEQGEFHTFVHQGPMFRSPLSLQVGEVVQRDGFIFADLLAPGDAGGGLPPAPGEIFDESGALSRDYLLRRGYCCENGCRNCPYGFRPAVEPVRV